MSWRPHGHVIVDPTAPEAMGICDRCGGAYGLRQLAWQFGWVGTILQNLRILVCPTCLDVPQEQLRTLILPPDPMPVMNARPEQFLLDDFDYRTTEDGDIRVTETNVPRVVENVANNRDDAS